MYRVKLFGHSAGIIHVVEHEDEIDIRVSLAKAGKAADRIQKTVVIFAALYLVFEVYKAWSLGFIQQAVR